MVNLHHPQSSRHGDGLVRDDPNLAGKLVHFHRKTHRRVQGFDPFAFQRLHQVAANVIALISAVMEFQRGNGSSGRTDRLPMQADDIADQRLGAGKTLTMSSR